MKNKKRMMSQSRFPVSLSKLWILFFLFLVLFLGSASTVMIEAQEPGAPGAILAEGDVTVKGLQLTVDTKPQAVPINTPTLVSTYFSVETPQLLKGIVIKGEMRGPGLTTPLQLTTLPNHPFSIPGFSKRGDYYLENVRLERNGVVLLRSESSGVLIQVMDIVVTKVTSRPLTMEEIREKGINITEANYTVFSITVGLEVASKPVEFNFPVIYKEDGPIIPTHGIGGGSNQTGGSSMGNMIPFNLNTPKTSENPNPDPLVSEEGEPARLTGFVIFKNDIAFLNQFFSIMFIVTNNAPEGSSLQLKDLKASITLPNELREAETTPPHVPGTAIPVRCPGPDEKLGTADDVNVILATFSGMAEFLAEGLKEGNHPVLIDFQGTMTGLPTGDVEVEGKANGMVVVRNPTFSVTFAHPEVIRSGEEYDILVTITNTSTSSANDLSLTMPDAKIIGCELLSDGHIELGDLTEGQSVNATFRMLSKRTGKVRAATIQGDKGVSGQLVLTVGVGESGIILSPDTLVLPSHAYKLPFDIINAAMPLLGEAHSIATTPSGSLSATLPMVTRSVVETRIIQMSEAGQRIAFDEPVVDSLAVLTLDWLGNTDNDLQFDILRRLTSKGLKLADAQANQFTTKVKELSPTLFQKAFTETCAYKNPFASVMLSFSGGARCANLTVSDYYQNSLARLPMDETDPEAEQQYTREIPFAEFFSLEDAGNNPVDYVLIGRMEVNGYNVDLLGESEGSFDLSLVVPDNEGNLRQVKFESIACQPGYRYSLGFKMEDTGYVLAVDTDSDGITDTTHDGTSEAIVSPSLKLVSAVQDCSVDEAGHVVALLFNRSVDEAGANTGSNFEVEGKQVYASFLQPSQRVILVGLDNPISPFVDSYIKVAGLTDTDGGAMQALADSQGMKIVSTIDTPGGVVYGKVLTSLGQPIAGAKVKLTEYKSSNDFTCSYTTTDAQGEYQFDYVRVMQLPFSIVVTDTQNGRAETVNGRIRKHDQRLEMDIYLRGWGRIHGKILDKYFKPAPAYIRYRAENDIDIRDRYVQADENGVFVIEDVPLGVVNLFGSYANQFCFASTALINTGETREVSLQLVETGTGTITGRVTTYSGEPVVGTDVFIYRKDVPINAWEHTDENGAFTFVNVPLGTISVRAWNPDTWNYHCRDVYLVEGQTVSTMLVFRGRSTVNVTVIDHGNTIVPDTEVWMSGTGDYDKTNDYGKISFEDVPVGNYNITAYHRETQRKATQSVNVNTEDEPVDVTVVFDAPPTYSAIKGTLYDIPDSDGQRSVMANQTVGVYNNLGGIVASVQTDASGHFQVDGLTPDSYTLAAALTDRAGFSQVSIGSAGQPEDTTINMVPQGTLAIDAFTENEGSRSAVMADVTIRYLKFEYAPSPHFESETVTLQTDGNGHVELHGAYYGAFTVKASNAFYKNGIYGGGVLDEPRKTVEIAMPLLGDVIVKVINPDGGDAGEGILLAYETGTVYFPMKDGKVTGSDSKFTIPLVPTGGFRVEAKNPNTQYVGVVWGEMASAGIDMDIELKLKGKADVTVTVNSHSGEAVANAAVTLKEAGYPYTQLPTFKTNSEGKVFFQGVNEGKFSVDVVDSNSGAGGRGTGSITGDGDAHNVEVEVTLAGYGSVEGIVFHANGSDVIAGAQVKLFMGEDDSPSGVCSSAADGSFHFEYVPLQSYRLEAFQPSTNRKGSARGVLVIADEISHTDVRLDGLGSVSGVFYDGYGTSPVPGSGSIYLQILGKPDRVTSYFNDEGSFRFENVPLGHFTLVAKDDGRIYYGKTENEVTVDGEEVVADIFAQKFGTVEGTVKNSEGVEIDGAVVSLVGREDKINTTTVIGKFTLEYIPVGNFTLKVESNKNVKTKAGVLTYHGQVLDAFDISLDPVGTVTVQVNDGSGTPIQGIDVTLESGILKNTLQTNSKGEVEFTGVPMGEFTLEAVERTLSGVPARVANADEILTSATPDVSVQMKVDTFIIVKGTLVTDIPEPGSPAQSAIVTLKGDCFTLVTNSDDTGVFTFNAVKLGDFSLAILGASGTGKALLSGTAVEGLTENTLDLGNIQLDNVLPYVLSITPNNNQTVSLTPQIIVTFSEAMNRAMLEDNNNIRLLLNNVNVPLGTPVVSADNKEVTLSLLSDLDSCQNYTVEVKNAITDPAGNELTTASFAYFTTLDSINPYIASVEPARSAVDVGMTNQIIITFNEDIQSGVEGDFTGNPSGSPYITVQKNSTPIGFTITKSGGKTLYIAPVNSNPDSPLNLESNSTYTIDIQGLADLAGNTMVSASFSFNTQDKIGPQLVDLQATNGTGVTEGANVTVTVSTLDTDVRYLYFYLDDVKLETQTPQQAINGLYSFTFEAPSQAAVGNSINVSAYAEDLKDNRGNRLNLKLDLLADEVPTITLTGPADTNVAPNQVVTFHVDAEDVEGLNRVQLTSIILDVPESFNISNGTTCDEFYTVTIPSDIAANTELEFVARAWDSRGQMAGSTVTLRVSEDLTAPTVEIGEPTGEGLTYKYPDTVVIKASACDNSAIFCRDGIDRVECYIVEPFGEDVLLGNMGFDEQYGYAYSYTVPQLEEDKIVTFKVKAFDNSGNFAEDTLTNVTLQKTTGGISMELLTPTDGSLVIPGEELLIRAIISDSEGEVSSVNYTILNSGNAVGGTNLSAGQSPGVFEGYYRIYEEASDGEFYTVKVEALSGIGTVLSTVQSTIQVVGMGNYFHLEPYTVIDENTFDFDGNDKTVVIDSGIVTINGAHTFKNILVKQSGVLVHQPADNATEFIMDLKIENKLVVGPNARIDCSRRGYLGGNAVNNAGLTGRTLGNVTTGGSENSSGGSYGGYGGSDGNPDNHVNETYGSVAFPVNPGSGGGSGGNGAIGGSGGGVVKIDATNGTLIIDGAIKCDGASTTDNAGAGSGGSVNIITGTLAGTGTISARGGSSFGVGAGGGGRIAVKYSSDLTFNPDNITTYGGVHSPNDGFTDYFNGGPGTVSIQKFYETGQIIVDNNGIKYVRSTPLSTCQPGTITALTSEILTDANANIEPGSLVGMILVPNIASPSTTFVISANTEQTITVGDTDDMHNLYEATVVGASYLVKHNSRLEVEDCNTYISGSISFPEVLLNNSVLVVDGGLQVAGTLTLQNSRITHGAITEANSSGLFITADHIMIDAASHIDADGLGYPGSEPGDTVDRRGFTYPYTRENGGMEGCGGSYGGLGGNSSTGTANQLYGSIANPGEPGSGGGGTTDVDGAPGGGIIRINCNTLNNDGMISARGANSTNAAGAGSGGAIYINSNSIAGSGSICANGGNSIGGGSGGGGRIALQYFISTISMDAITAYGGTHGASMTSDITKNGSAGTIYIYSEEAPLLLVNNRGQASADPSIFPVISPTEYSTVTQTQLTNVNASYIPGSLVGMELIPDTSDMDTTFTILANDNTTITIDSADGNLAEALAADKVYTGKYIFNGHLEINNTTAQLCGDVNLNRLTIKESGELTHPAGTTVKSSYLNLSVSGRVEITESSAINVDGKGYPGALCEDNTGITGYTFPNTADNGSQVYSGGSHGGAGGIALSSQTNTVYGSLYKPLFPGSGGGGAAGIPGGSGGGTLRITADTLLNNGSISANGQIADSGGGGAGGSVYLNVNTLDGTGTISADGGDSTGGGSGSGGRIALYYTFSMPEFRTQIEAVGGTGASTQLNGGAGTVYIKSTNDNYGELIVDNKDIQTNPDSTPIPSVGEGNSTQLLTFQLTNNAATFIPGTLVGMKLRPDKALSSVYTIIANTSTDIFTSDTDGDITASGSVTVGSVYTGEHIFKNLIIRGSSHVLTYDIIDVIEIMDITGGTLTAQNQE